MTPTPDTEIVLTHGDLRLVVAPYGASLRGLSRVLPGGGSEQIVAGYTGAKGKVGGQGDVLIPFPGRVAEGRYTFQGQAYQMEKNDAEGPNAIHGFLRKTLWDMEQNGPSEAAFTTALAADAHPGYPFALAARVTYRVDEDGLTCSFAVGNVGDKAAPVGTGFHPYFTVGSALIDADTLHVPMASTLEYKDLVPTGRVLSVEGSALDFRKPHTIGGVVFNDCYLDPMRDADGRVRIRLSGGETGRSVTVWMDEAFGYVVLYSGDPLPNEHRRRSLAIEPMTCGSDAFNHPEWGLSALAPGQTLSGSWGVTAE